jgi:hypothetical protein
MERMLDWFEGTVTDIADPDSMSTSLNVLVCQPNPFNNETFIRIDLEEDSEFCFDIINFNGKKIKSFNRPSVFNDHHGIVWDATNNSGVKVKPGVYFGVLKSGSIVETVKFVITN